MLSSKEDVQKLTDRDEVSLRMCKGYATFFWGEAARVQHAKKTSTMQNNFRMQSNSWLDYYRTLSSPHFRERARLIKRPVKRRAARNAGAAKEEFYPWCS